MTPIGAHLDVTSQVRRNIPPEIAFDFAILIDQLADLNHVIIGKVVAF